jgi:predicted nucleic acid-binding protein
MSGSFFDTNVPVYLLGTDARKLARARTVLEPGGLVSVQVLNEIANVCLRKLKLDWSRLRQFFREINILVDVVPLTRSTHELGLSLAERYRFAVYDAMIVAAALEGGCDTLYSEDMRNGLVVDGRLTIVNPFNEAEPGSTTRPS